MRLHIQAVSELCGRYVSAFRHAWRHRAAMAGVDRLPHEAQFLPAALSLQETPLSPAPRVAMWLLMGFAMLALLWACLGEMDIVATAQGKVIPSNRSKTIQPFEAARVKAIHVTDGQAVKAGDVLIELDATTAHADLERVRGDLAVARLQVARGQAILAALDGTGAPTLPRVPGASEVTYLEAQRLLAGQIEEYTAKRNRVAAEIAMREAEMRSTQALIRKLEQTLPIAAQRATDFRNLVSQNFVSKHGYLEREQARIEQEADLVNLRSRLTEIAASLRQTQGQNAELSAGLRRTTLDSMTEGRQRAAALEQDLLKADERGRLLQLTSPVDGTVQQLVAHTVGGVVTPAQPLMIIVPRDDALEVEAFLENKDVGFVRAGQRVEVKIETFQYTKYGTIPATVASVSHDAINDEKRGLIYSTRVLIDKKALMVDGALTNLSPGMAVTVEVKTSKRRVIDYFLSPLQVHTGESMRER